MKQQNGRNENMTEAPTDLGIVDKFTNVVLPPIVAIGYIGLQFSSIAAKPFSTSLSNRLESKANSLIIE